jgi:SAM-dependent methyltransferase
MSTFGTYSRYYDLLYRDKDYLGEVQFLRGLLDRYSTSTQSILELGCGTGVHAAQLASHGYRVHGIDVSEEMLTQALVRQSALPEEAVARLDFSRDDLRSLRLNRKFDAVVSLFHVMSYQLTDADLLLAFKTAKDHLRKGGVFIFDCWYGPAVLRELPSTRVKRFEDDEIEVTRIAEPQVHVNRNYVDVNYQIFIREKTSNCVEIINETHAMRYLFFPEVESLFEAVGMKLVFSCEWLTGKEPGADTWGVCFGGLL